MYLIIIFFAYLRLMSDSIRKSFSERMVKESNFVLRYYIKDTMHGFASTLDGCAFGYIFRLQ